MPRKNSNARTVRRGKKMKVPAGLVIKRHKKPITPIEFILPQEKGEL
jgi:hypothetical protein